MSEHTAAGEEKPSLLSNILAIIGLIILVIIIVWGLVHLAELSSGWFSSLFQKSAPTIQIETPTPATAGTPENISWSYTTSASGTYAFLYQCQDGLEFALINTTTNTASGIPCGTANAVSPTSTNNSNSIEVLPIFSGTASTSVPFSIIFTPASGAAVEGSATMTVNPGSIQTQTQTSTSSEATKTATTQSSQTQSTAPVTRTTAPARSYYAPADLSVYIISDTIDQYGNGSVSFRIANIGGSRSGSYAFSAEMPTQTGTPYTSAMQAPLAPESSIIDTLHFSEAVSGTFSVVVAGGNDANRSNNYASVWMTPSQQYDYNYNAYGNYNPYNVNYQTGSYNYYSY